MSRDAPPPVPDRRRASPAVDPGPAGAGEDVASTRASQRPCKAAGPGSGPLAIGPEPLGPRWLDRSSRVRRRDAQDGRGGLPALAPRPVAMGQPRRTIFRDMAPLSPDRWRMMASPGPHPDCGTRCAFRRPHPGPCQPSHHGLPRNARLRRELCPRPPQVPPLRQRVRPRPIRQATHRPPVKRPKPATSGKCRERRQTWPPIRWPPALRHCGRRSALDARGKAGRTMRVVHPAKSPARVRHLQAAPASGQRLSRISPPAGGRGVRWPAQPAFGPNLRPSAAGGHPHDRRHAVIPAIHHRPAGRTGTFAFAFPDACPGLRCQRTGNPS